MDFSSLGKHKKRAEKAISFSFAVEKAEKEEKLLLAQLQDAGVT
jgi:hypothetical protein